MKKHFFSLFILLMCASSAHAQVRWHNEVSDTTRLTDILTRLRADRSLRPGQRVAMAAREFVGTPYVAHTLEHEPEMLTVNLDELDCTTFAETVTALAYTAGEQRTAWQDFVYNLRMLRYRGGVADGYASRLHYICDWATDNVHNGMLTDATRLMPQYFYVVRSIDFMSNHRDSYPALKDSVEFEKIRQVENGFRNHRFPYVKTGDLGRKDTQAALREGDILAFVSNLKDLDVTHMGLLVREGNEWHVIHASSTNGRVEVSKGSLADFVRRNRGWIGVRIFRLNQ